MFTTNLPTVTILMPIRNESEFIERSLKAVLDQDYPPHLMEIVVVDGQSTDETRKLIDQMLKECPTNSLLDFKILENPQRITPVAMNIGINNSVGDVVILVGGHTEIDATYVSASISALRQSGADCVGGPLQTVGATTIARAIAAAQGSKFGVGGVSFRDENAVAGYVDTVAFGAYPRTVFEQIGLFDDELVRNQDDELNFRLTQNGGKIWLDPSIKVIYFSRASLSRLWKQYYEYGLYKVRVIQKRGAVPALRHLVPSMFVSALILAALISLITANWIWLFSILGVYLLANLFASSWTARNEIRTFPYVLIATAILHFSYGTGFLIGIWQWRKYNTLFQYIKTTSV